VALTIGIVGLPNVGKSTLFNALTRATVLAANYPFATIEPNVGVVPLPDPRLGRLAELFHSAKVVPATVSFVDIAGIVRGASEGEGLGNQFLANIREADAICMVTRAFEDPDVTHVDGRIEPAGDIETIATELILADIQTLEKAIPRLEKEVRGKKTEAAVLETARAALKVLGEGTVLSAALASGAAAKAGIDGDVLSTFQLMTTKPIIHVFNMDDAGMSDEARQSELRALVAPRRPKSAPGGTGRGGVFHSYAGSSRSSWPGRHGGVMCCGMILPERRPAVWRPPDGPPPQNASQLGRSHGAAPTAVPELCR